MWGYPAGGAGKINNPTPPTRAGRPPPAGKIYNPNPLVAGCWLFLLSSPHEKAGSAGNEKRKDQHSFGKDFVVLAHNPILTKPRGGRKLPKRVWPGLWSSLPADQRHSLQIHFLSFVHFPPMLSSFSAFLSTVWLLFGKL